MRVPVASDWMAEGDRSSIDIEPFAVEVKIAVTSQNLRGKSLVQFDEIEVLQCELVLCFQLPDGRNGADAHDPGIDARRK